MSQEGYFEVPHIPRLCKPYSHNTKYTLVVYDFGIKYQFMDNSNHIIQYLQNNIK